MKILFENESKKVERIKCDRLYISPEKIALFEDNACIKSIDLKDVIMISDNNLESPIEYNRIEKIR